MLELPALSEQLAPFRVATVGTGTCVPQLARGGACVLVRGPGATVAVDLGLGALHGLLRRGVRHQELDAVFLTHLHPDHSAELVSFFFAANYDEEPRVRPLVVVGGPGVAQFLEDLGRVYGRWLEPQGYDRAVRELEAGGEVRLGAVICRAGPASHTPSSLAYRFESGGRCVVLTGDTGPCPGLERFARHADLLVSEASLATGTEGAGHLSARQAGELGRRAGAERLVLTHLYPAAEASSPREAAAAAFGGPVAVAWDGMEVEV